MNDSQSTNRAKLYQLALFPLNNGATNVYFVLILSYIAIFGNKVLGLAMVFASFMVLGNVVMAVSVLALYVLTPLVPESVMWLRWCCCFYGGRGTRRGI